MCVCVCVVCARRCAHNCVQPSRDTKFLWPWVRQSWNWPNGKTSGIDQKKANAWFDLKLRPNTYCQGMLILSPGFRSQVERKTLSGAYFCQWVLESHSPSCLLQPVIDNQRIALTQASFPWCSFLWICVLMGVSNKESLEWNQALVRN